MRSPTPRTVDDLDLQIREIGRDDIPYCSQSWLKTHRTSELGRGLENSAYYALHHPVVGSLLEDSSLMRVVATPVEDSEMIAGFMIANPDGPILYYLHVRGPFRGLGVARLLLSMAGIEKGTPFAMVYDTRDFRRARAEKGWDGILRPDLLRNVGRKV